MSEPLSDAREAVIRRDIEAARHPPPRYDPSVAEAIGWAWDALALLDAARAERNAAVARIEALETRVAEQQEAYNEAIPFLRAAKSLAAGYDVDGLIAAHAQLEQQRDAAVAILRRADVERQSPEHAGSLAQRGRRNLVHVGFIHDALVALGADAKETN